MSLHQGAPVYRALRGQEQTTMVTGEGVLVDVPAASLPERLLSGLIDAILHGAGFAGTVVLLILSPVSTSTALFPALTVVSIAFWTVVVPAAEQTLTRGRSPGKMIARLRTVRDDGGPIVLRHALTRALVGVVEIYALAGVPALLCAMSTARCRRIGDLAAGTSVVRDTARLTLPPPPQMPLALASWAQQADIAALPDGLALSIRQLLQRSQMLAPVARQALGERLLAQTLPLVAPPPPPGHPGEAVLAAVLTVRRERDAGRLAREESLRQRVLPPDLR